jgi:Spy/CpxP family protein refolding chaperone
MKRFNLTTTGIIFLVAINLCVLAVLVFRPHQRFHGGDRFNRSGPSFNMGEGVSWHGPGRHGHHRRDALLQDLNLTEEQKNKLKLLEEEKHKNAENWTGKMQDLSKKEAELLKANKLDDSKKNELAEEFAGYQKAMHLNMLSHMQAFNNILTPEQRENFTAKVEMKHEGRKGKHHRCN